MPSSEVGEMTSPLVRRLFTKIDQSKQPETRACYVAELACYWARIGEFSEAEKLRSELRQSFGDGHSARVSILIMCVEALIGYFRDLSPNARDRMARASLLSAATRDHQLIALTSAWMAHIDFNMNRFESMALAISTCLSSLESDDGTVECRIALVLGDAYLFAGALLPSNAWYTKARSAAEKTGDQAAIGALTYNRAALHVAAARFRRACQDFPALDVNIVRAEVESAVNYQSIAQLKSLDHLLQTARIGILILQERVTDALPAIINLLESRDVPEGSAQEALLQADKAHALAALGQTSAALEVVRLISEEAVASFGPDDRALIWSSILETSKICGALDLISRYELERAGAQAEYGKMIVELNSLLTPFENPLIFSR